MSRPSLSRREATQRAEWTRFQDGEFEMLSLGSGRKARANHSAKTPTKDEIRLAVTIEDIDDVQADKDSADEVQEDLEDSGSNGDVGSSKSSFDDVTVCRKNSGEGVFSTRVTSGKDIFAAAAEPPPLRRLRNTSSALFDAAQSIGFPRLVRLRPPVESEDEGLPQPPLKAFFAARKHRQKVITSNTREQTRRSIRQQVAQSISKPPKLNMQHFNDQPYTLPVNFVPGSSEARQWIARMCDVYAYKRDSHARYQQEIKDILTSVVGRPASARITASRDYKRIVWLQEQLRLLLKDITAFMASFPQYIDLHEAACDAAERQAKENIEHFTFCLTILQDHYEKHGRTFAGVDQKVANWNDGFKFLQAESPWEHPEMHTWEGWVWESWDPELSKNGMHAQVEIAQDASGNGNDISESLVDDLGKMMSNMVIGV